MKKIPLAVLVAAIVMTATAAIAAPCRDRRHGRPCPPRVQVIVDSESSKIRLVRVEEAIDAQNDTVNALVGSHNDLVGRVAQDRNASEARDGALRSDLDSEIETRRASDAETANLILDGINADDEISAKAAEAEAKAAEARAKAERLERELRVLKAKKEKEKK